VNDELDVFSNEVEFSMVGHKYPFFSPQISISPRKIKKLIEYDLSIIGKMRNVKEASRRVENSIIEGEATNIVQELKKIRHYITVVRNNYKDRNHYIKGIA
jgi:hypothetical protein